MKKPNFMIIALSPVGNGLSGGDRIFIELARNLSKKDMPVTIVTWDDGVNMCQRQQLTEQQARFDVLPITNSLQKNFVLCYFTRIIKGMLWALTTAIPTEKHIIYSASDFWMDSLPAAILKLRNKQLTWVAAWYQTAPSPWKGYSESDREKKYHLNALLYWLVQLPIKPIVSKLADYVCVNNEEEKKEFPILNKKGKVITMLGAVDIDKIENWKKDHKTVRKEFDAVFQGRFHAQKGVLELLQIWKKVVNKKSDAKLAMIGDGPLMPEAKKLIRELQLHNNVTLFGYLFDGDEKYTVFSQSKLVVHPAFFDSGGMAAEEAMVFGMPCVGFDLPSYTSYYPKGMVKVPVGDLDQFAETIITLLNKKETRDRIGKEGMEYIMKHNSWKQRTDQLLKQLQI